MRRHGASAGLATVPRWSQRTGSVTAMNLSGDSPNNAGSQYSERRTVPRFSFIAAAEIVEPVSGVHISGRISEISRKGCYVDLLNTLPTGTTIEVQITGSGGLRIVGQNNLHTGRYGDGRRVCRRPGRAVEDSGFLARRTRRVITRPSNPTAANSQARTRDSAAQTPRPPATSPRAANPDRRPGPHVCPDSRDS